MCALKILTQICLFSERIFICFCQENKDNTSWDDIYLIFASTSLSVFKPKIVDGKIQQEL